MSSSQRADLDDGYEFRLSDRAEFTVGLVKQALQRYEDEGWEATLSYYNSPESAVGEWYVFILDENDEAVAHLNQDLLGRDLKGDLGVDVTGYRFGEVMLGATEDGLWVDYLFLNPHTGNQEFKHSWVVRYDGLLFGSGWYEVLPSSPLDATKADPAEYTVAVVDGLSATTRPTAERERCNTTKPRKAWMELGTFLSSMRMTNS